MSGQLPDLDQDGRNPDAITARRTRRDVTDVLDVGEY